MSVDLLSYPSDEADTAKAAIDELVELVGSWITKRSGWAETYLPSWSGPNQVAWSDEFGYAQGDAAVMIDDLQAVRDSIESTMSAIASENSARRAEVLRSYGWPAFGDTPEPFSGPYVPPPDSILDVFPLRPSDR